MIWTIIVVLILFWLFGNILEFGGDLLHLLLVVAVVVFLFDYFTSRRPRV